MVIYRINNNLQVFESLDENSWKKSTKDFLEAISIAKIFKDNGKINLIIDNKNSKFLKGKFDNKPLGERINVLPNGIELTKAYSIFSPELHIHDESSHGHWDIILKNPNGKYSYIYTKDKEKLSKSKKYAKVEIFEKLLPKIKEELYKNLSKDKIALPIIILLETKMRVGSEIYYKKNGHRGLTTLQKKDISIDRNELTFDFPSKDGVPQRKTKQFLLEVIEKIKDLKIGKKNDFIFTNTRGKIFTDNDFEKAFEKYSGVKFYPHIVRSHYATKAAEEFLKLNKTPSINTTKEFCKLIAEELGHKKYSKKKDSWEDSYGVTLHYYIRPDLSEKILSFLKK